VKQGTGTGQEWWQKQSCSAYIDTETRGSRRRALPAPAALLAPRHATFICKSSSAPVDAYWLAD
jgi:hypothetical protein